MMQAPLKLAQRSISHRQLLPLGSAVARLRLPSKPAAYPEPLSQWTVAARRRHPLLATALRLIVQRGRGGIRLTDPNFVHYHTGPGEKILACVMVAHTC